MLQQAETHVVQPEDGDAALDPQRFRSQKSIRLVAIRVFVKVYIQFTVETLSNEMLEKMLEHPRFLDIAMKKVGSRIEYEHVRLHLYM